MATKLGNSMSEKGIETFGAAVPDNASVMVKALSILAGIQSYCCVYLPSARTASTNW
jgi:hypothetical protein